MEDLIIATRNPQKTREFARLFGSEFHVRDLAAEADLPEVIESGASFEENARLKALVVSSAVPGLVLADDSGLEVDSLGGAPGIFSARYAGESATDAQNRQKLLRALAQLPSGERRTARFRCALALARASELIAQFKGVVEGEIVARERGAAGFGYDPIFRPLGREQTFAEMSAEEKDRLSHRGAAVAELLEFLRRSDSAANQ